MNNDNIRNAYDAMSPSELAKARMFRNISAAVQAPHKTRIPGDIHIIVAAVQLHDVPGVSAAAPGSGDHAAATPFPSQSKKIIMPGTGDRKSGV